MKILVIGMSDNWGGVEAFIYEYYKRLSSDEMQFDFMVFGDKCADVNKLVLNESKVYYIKTSHFRELKKYHAELEKFFKEHEGKYDCIWANMCDLSNACVLRFAKKYGIKRRIVHSHNNRLMSQGKKTSFYMMRHNHYKNIISKIATDFWACSDLAGEFFYNKNIMNSKKYKVISNGIDVKKFRFDGDERVKYRKKLELDDKIVLGNVSRLHSQKNQKFAIEIVYELAKLNPKYHMIFIGSGDDEAMLKNKVKELSLQKHVSFIGARSDIPELLSAMDIFLFPSIFEGLGIALLEAQASGLPSFTSKDVVPAEVNITGLVKFISLSKNANQWAKEINSVDLSKDRMAYNEVVERTNYNVDNEVEKVKRLLSKKG